ncbi:hypothetical protein NDU88_005100 [Pleurodeles waltl]|uniref:Uncharacterized protein n=1 Tax=Pleurodeles waltl TaxID=8319 RepID=A0AAV7UIK8_PLEWA|nr:hypothetical protein NDU88_005100 [Pleurodeles waltl]
MGVALPNCERLNLPREQCEDPGAPRGRGPAWWFPGNMLGDPGFKRHVESGGPSGDETDPVGNRRMSPRPRAQSQLVPWGAAVGPEDGGRAGDGERCLEDRRTPCSGGAQLSDGGSWAGPCGLGGTRPSCCLGAPEAPCAWRRSGVLEPLRGVTRDRPEGRGPVGLGP